MFIGEFLKEERTKAEAVQPDFAARLKVSLAYYKQLENNVGRPSWDLLLTISKELKIALPIIVFRCTTEKDIPIGKRKIFREIKPQIDELLNKLS
jgi:transcriptional regulator with XRE-family HTH domain